MKTCTKCHNLAPPEATACPHCGTVLDQAVIARATGAARPRQPTIAEVPEATRPVAPPRSEYRPTPPPALPLTGAVPSFTVPAGAPMPPSGRRGQTVYMPPGSQGTAVQPALSSGGRRVVAVLVTYSWKPEGQIFPIREGRNLIGRGEECDIRIPEDAMLSQVNTHITFRQNFTLGDMVSMSGTDLNGTPVEEQFRPIENLSRIRAGATNLLFVIVDPALLGVT